MLYNRKRAAEYLEEYNLAAVVATTPFSVAYFTDFDCWQYRDFRENMATPGASNSLLQTYALYAPDHDPVLVTSTGSVQFTDERKTNMKAAALRRQAKIRAALAAYEQRKA